MNDSDVLDGWQWDDVLHRYVFVDESGVVWDEDARAYVHPEPEARTVGEGQ